MIASKPGAEDTQAMAARALWLEELFFLDGRDMISHPQHGLFTGLALKYQACSQLTVTNGQVTQWQQLCCR